MDVKISRPESGHARAGNRSLRALVTVAVLAIGHPGLSFASGDAAHGATVYHDCMICHSLDRNSIGPKHRDVFGRKAGSVADYNYSAALKSSNIVWDETTLDQWLSNPQALVPGTKMMYSVPEPRDRADLIAFLKEKARSDPSSATDGVK